MTRLCLFIVVAIFDSVLGGIHKVDRVIRLRTNHCGQIWGDFLCSNPVVFVKLVEYSENKSEFRRNVPCPGFQFTEIGLELNALLWLVCVAFAHMTPTVLYLILLG